MKRLLSYFIALLFIFYVPIQSHAFSVESTGNMHAQPQDVANLWIALADAQKIIVDNDGFFCILPNEFVNHPSYSRILSAIEHCNLTISKDIMIASSPLEFSLTTTASTSCNQILEMRNQLYNTPADTPIVCAIGNQFSPIIHDGGGSSHPCTAQSIDLLSICEENYTFISEYYQDMLIMTILNPAWEAWSVSVLYWISLVQPGGEWDYKVSEQYGPYNNALCAYYNGEYHHFTAEYFGNLNYGYTGSLFFNLSTLHLGSSAVAGFDAADEVDWPAIDEGYYLKTGS